MYTQYFTILCIPKSLQYFVFVKFYNIVYTQYFTIL